MEVTNQTEWNACQAANTDSYGGAVIEYAERWADLMEAGLADGACLADIAKPTSHAADTDTDGGLTGFMYGCAVGILSRVWLHGEGLRCWHNLDSQIGTEGERANETGGTLNPALLVVDPKPERDV